MLLITKEHNRITTVSQTRTRDHAASRITAAAVSCVAAGASDVMIAPGTAQLCDPDLRNRRILIVDEDDEARQTFGRMPGMEGILALSARTGREGIELGA